MKMRHTRFGLAMIGLLLLLPRHNASAAEEEKLITVLQGLEWGISHTQVLEYFQQKLHEDFKEETKEILDPVKIDKIRQQKNQEYKKIEESYLKLEGEGKTGLEISIVASEYGKNNGESVLVVRDSVAQKYYFFGDNMLYKVAIAYNADYIKGIGFEAFIGQVEKKYGRADETTFDEYEENLLRAQWRADETDLRVENKDEFFGTFMMVFYDHETDARLTKLRTTYGDDQSNDEVSVNKDILDAEEEDPFNVDDDVVDDILGQKTEVDLEEGMPEQERIRRIGEDDGGNGDADSVDSLPDEEKKKKKKENKKKKDNKKKKKTKLENVEDEKNEDDIIIY